ncbi:unnamed protein product [Penicillium glandicola]
MALMLAPYNEAMRLGMGFNSYTQQLCLNDVVRKPGGIKASEKDLRTQPSSQITGSSEKNDDKLLDSQKGELVRRTMLIDGQKEVSQVVSWEAGFVDNISEVTDKLHIKGALQITADAIGGGGGAEASYVNNSSFAKADVKYDITVKVTNERRIADDVTEFSPLPHVPDGKFTELYGDCFISGFIEGGVFHALVTRTEETKSAKKDMGGKFNLNVSAAGGAVKVDGSGEGGKEESSEEKHYSTQISVNWSGGGDIKPNDIVQWDVNNLMKVAMEFPDNVASCPQRTYAILTKYTALRSYHEETVRGSPLDYENAGIYTSSLLDAYAEYKSIWKDIHQTIGDLNNGNITITPKDETPGMKDYALSFKTDHQKRMEQYTGVVKAIKANPEAYKGVTVEEPLPPTELVPYKGDFFALDTARRDCRFEMIKIVREVNEVTVNPQISTDPNRNWRYLSPNIFKLLVPSAGPLGKTKSKAELEKEKQELENQLKNAKGENEALKAQHVSAEAERLQSTNKEATQKVQAERERDEWVTKYNSAVVSAQQTNKAQNKQIQDLRTEIERLQPKVFDEVQDEDVQILSITYGSRIYYDTRAGDINGLLPAFKNAARGQNWFTVSNGLFRDDPNVGHYKSMVIVYRYNRPGVTRRLRTLTGWEEGSQVKFDDFTFA